ncbi:C-C motif chemokine 27a [Gouania willdenowi]|uniref:C-C motif chemokine 25-like n=1 Tax=Gouania willdenowi TaxID=441366 RepID=A0A8C5E4N6_GOUWI|nr:C-C motif chemokine 25-like [Gouania willdenowi]
MDVKLVFVMVGVWALCFTSTDAGIPKCCLTARTDIPLPVLLRVQRWTIQPNTGACDIAALILHVRNLKKPICAHPKIKAMLTKIQRKMKRNAQRMNH